MFCIEEESSGMDTAGVFKFIVNSCVTFTIPSRYSIKSVVLILYSSCAETLLIVSNMIKEISVKLVLRYFVLYHCI